MGWFRNAHGVPVSVETPPEPSPDPNEVIWGYSKACLDFTDGVHSIAERVAIRKLLAELDNH